MNISNQEYGDLTKKRSPNSKMYKTLPKAFLIGGTICTLGEGLLNLYAYLGLKEEHAAAGEAYADMAQVGADLCDRLLHGHQRSGDGHYRHPV